MKKTIKKYFSIGILLLIIVIAIFFINEGKEANTIKVAEEEILVEDFFSNVEEVHFNHTPITYTITINNSEYGKILQVESTDEYKIMRIKWALEIIKNSTGGLVKFEEVENPEDADIEIYGIPGFYCNEFDGEFYKVVEGFAGPQNTTDNVITKSGVWFCAPSYFIADADVGDLRDVPQSAIEKYLRFSWYKDSCEEFPHVEIHEILHAFGFDHIYDNSKEIMYPIDFKIQNCQNKELDSEISSCLKYIYSNGDQGSCQNVSMYPWSEDPGKNITDFKWDSLPVSYSIHNCIERQTFNLQSAERILEDYSGHNFLEFREEGESQINFYCENSVDGALLNWETDLWTTTNYFPAAQPEYFFENNKIENVNITLFGQNRTCGGIELHEFLHGLGLRGHYGLWMKSEREVCKRDGVVDRYSIEKLKEIYLLNG